MFIRAMRAVAVRPHPNADALRIYEFSHGEAAPIVVIANLDNVYEVGDVVAIATVGSVLRDGTRIRKSRLRGVDSFGMALGPTDLPEGSDLTEALAQPADTSRETKTPVVKWTSIELLHSLRRSLAATHEVLGTPLPAITYRAKVKLDGTNAAVHVLEDGFAAQSRTRLLTLDDDNHGFARWLQESAADWAKSLHAVLGRAVVFGEWAGRGIQRRTAVATLERPIFAVFAIQTGDPEHDVAGLIVDPDRIRELLPPHPDVHVLPWHGPSWCLDFSDRERLEEAASQINALVADVETRDPWVAEVFDREGVGEGVVLYPVQGGPVAFDEQGKADRDAYVSLIFKAKGEKHQVVRQKQAVQLDPEVAAGIEGFVALMVTPARLEQALAEGAGGELSMKRMGDFLRWIGQDVRKESEAELEAAGLEWKQVGRAVGQAARQWFKAAVEKAD